MPTHTFPSSRIHILNTSGSGFRLWWVSAVVGNPAEAVSSFLRPGGEGVPMRKRLSPYGAVFPHRSSEGPDVAFRLCSIRHRAAVVAAKRRLQAGERTVHAYDLWSLLPRGGRDVQDGVAARADVPQHVLHWVRGLCLISLVQPLPFAGTQRGSVVKRRRLLPLCYCHELLRESSRNKMQRHKADLRDGIQQILTSSTEARCLARLASCLRWTFLSWRASVPSWCPCPVSPSAKFTQ